MSIFSIISKNKSLIFYTMVLIIAGFLLLFFYQTMVESKVTKFKVSYDYYSYENLDEFFLLYGWQIKKEDCAFASMKGERAVCLFSIPKKDAAALTLTYRFQNPKQAIKIYHQGHFLGELKTDRPGEWVEHTLIFPAKFAKKDLNKLVFIKSLDDSQPSFRMLTVENYKDKKLVFLRAYTVWETTRWFARRGNKPVNWQFCLWGGIALLGLWLAYSALLWSITDESYFYVLKLDFWTYLPAVIIFSILFLIGRVISAYSFFCYKLDFWLILIGSISIGKIYQLIKFRYTQKKDKLKLRMRQLKNNTIGKYNLYANVFIVSFMTLFFICSILLIFGMKLEAEWWANLAFLFLIMGVILKSIRYFAQKDYLKD